MYFLECDEGLVAHTADAARALGLEELAAQFELVARGTTKSPGRARLGSPQAVKALERFASTEVPPRLLTRVRQHARSFVPVWSEPPPA